MKKLVSMVATVVAIFCSNIAQAQVVPCAAPGYGVRLVGMPCVQQPRPVMVQQPVMHMQQKRVAVQQRELVGYREAVVKRPVYKNRTVYQTVTVPVPVAAAPVYYPAQPVQQQRPVILQQQVALPQQQQLTCCPPGMNIPGLAPCPVGITQMQTMNARPVPIASNTDQGDKNHTPGSAPAEAEDCVRTINGIQVQGKCWK